MSNEKTETANRERFYEDLAKRFVTERFMDLHDLTFNAVHWGGVLYARHDNRYAPLTETEANCLLRQWCLTNGVAQNNRIIGNTMPIVKTLLTEDRHRHPRMPFYRGNDKFPKPSDIIAFRNGLLDIEAWLKGGTTLLPHTPLWVSTSCLPFDFDPTATCPRWARFVQEVFPKDDGQKETLQEWFGYCLASDTSLQKFCIWVGVGANGKGTAWEVLRQLVGEHSAGAFSLHQLAKDFGLSPLVDKAVAYCGEAELKGVADRNRILETLKGITGEDPQQVNRKFDPDGAILVMPTRLVIACNRLPTLYETTGAVSRRMLLQRFDECFEGKEDFNLKGKLVAELPGICNWALEGSKRLRTNGRFTMAAAMTEAVNDYRRDNAPEFAFVQDRLVVSRAVNPGNLHGVELTDDDTVTASKSAVVEAYRNWCAENDTELDDKRLNWFWRSINDIMPRLKDKGRIKGKGQNMTYKGITLKTQSVGGAA